MVMKTAVVTDSTADLPTKLAQELEICVIPAILVIDGESYEDGEDISREDFYKQLPNMEKLPTTAAPSSGKFQECYEHLLVSGADHILSIHVAGKLSGILNSAQAAANQFGDRVRILDSGQVTLGLGFQAMEAARASLDNLPIEIILKRIYEVRQRVKVIALLDTLEYLRRSGRVSWTRASLGSLLQIKPLIELSEGQVYRLGEARTRKKGIDRLQKLLLEAAPINQLAFVHTNAEEDANYLLKEIQADLDHLPLMVHVTTVIGTHVGPNGLGFVAIRK